MKWTFRALGAIAALIVATATAQPITAVYRADARPPDIVFAYGFVSTGQNLNVIEHAFEGSCDAATQEERSAWVSTSASLEQARLFAEARLRGIETDGWSETMWMYTIRADSRFLSVPYLLSQVMELGYANLNGYTPTIGHIGRGLMASRPVTVLEEVIAPIVEPTLIQEARPYWYSGGQVILGPSYVNHLYVHDDTSANTGIPANVHSLIPPSMSRIPDRGRSCSMQCDNARTSASASVGGEAFDGSVQCRIWSGGMSPTMIRSAL